MGLFGKKKKAEAELATANTASAAISEETIAVISAAVAAYEAEQYTQTLYIRKLNRAAGARPAWGVAGTNEAIDARNI